MSKGKSIPFITAEFINDNTHYPDLIEALKTAFANHNIIVPDRHHHNYGDQNKSTLLLMPAWQNHKDLGLKVVTVNPENTSIGIPSIQGLYFLADADTGVPKAILDAKSLTNKRTAATSALAASYLARKNCSSLLMVGTGALAPELISAHSSYNSITKVYVWGRNAEKSKEISERMLQKNIQVESIIDLNSKLGKVDIISVATFASSPLIKGRYLNPGQHLDLVGSYKPDMREADDDVIRKADIYVDTLNGATQESGDLYIPLQNGIIRITDIKSDLQNLCNENHPGRTEDDQITMFKSVGYALEDLVAANYYYRQYTSQ